MQIHCDYVVGACHTQHIGHQFGRYGCATLSIQKTIQFASMQMVAKVDVLYLVLFVLSGIREHGNHGRDPGGRGYLASIYHNKQLHYVVVY